jgi:hypothetical protein
LNKIDVVITMGGLGSRFRKKLSPKISYDEMVSNVKSFNSSLRSEDIDFYFYSDSIKDWKI